MAPFAKKAGLICSLGMATALTVNASLILNGDFESPVVPPGSANGVLTLAYNSTLLPGWTVVGGAGDNVNLVSAGAGVWPGNSTQFMDLNGFTGGGGIQSDPIATVNGWAYQVTFNAFNGSLIYPGTAWTGPALSLQASGGPLQVYNGTTDVPAGYTEALTYSFTAASTSTTLTFLDQSDTAGQNTGWIDNVAIQPIPEPTTILAGALLLLPFGASSLKILHRKRQ
jgi:hypothetical protein